MSDQVKLLDESLKSPRPGRTGPVEPKQVVKAGTPRPAGPVRNKPLSEAKVKRICFEPGTKYYRCGCGHSRTAHKQQYGEPHTGPCSKCQCDEYLPVRMT